MLIMCSMFGDAESDNTTRLHAILTLMIMVSAQPFLGYGNRWNRLHSC